MGDVPTSDTLMTIIRSEQNQFCRSSAIVRTNLEFILSRFQSGMAKIFLDLHFPGKEKNAVSVNLAATFLEKGLY
jgi:hypothetical protein